MIRNSTLWLAPLALTSAASAQLPTYSHDQQVVQLGAAMAALPSAAAIFEAMAVNIDDDLDADLVYRVDGGLLVCPNVIASGSAFLVARPINDLATFTGANGQTLLVLAEPTGVSILDLQVGGTPTIATWSEENSAQADLIDLAAVEIEENDAPTPSRLIGIHANHSQLVAMIMSSGSGSQLTPDATFSSPQFTDAWDLVLTDCDQDGTGEIAVLSQSGLSFSNPDGTLAVLHPYVSTHGSLIKFDNLTNQRVAWIRPSVSPVGYELVIASPTSLSTPIYLGTELMFGASGELNVNTIGTEYEDLVLTSSDASQALLLENQYGVFSMANSQVVSAQPTQSTIDCRARPIVADLDADGTVDFALANHVLQQVNVFYNEDAGTYGDLRPPFNYLDLSTPGMALWNLHPYGHDPAPVDKTDIEVKVRRQAPHPVTGWDPPMLVDLDAYYVGFADASFVPPEEQTGPRSISFPIAPDGLENQTPVIYVQGRFVVRDSGGIIKKYPPYTFVMCDPNHPAALSYLVATQVVGVLIGRRIGNGDHLGVGEIPPPPPPPTPVIPPGGV